MDQQKIEEQKHRIASHFSNSQALLDYLFETLNNFYYRYLETTISQNLHTTELAPKVWGAQSVETNSMEILKIKNPAIRPHLINAAKALGAKGGLNVTYTLGFEPKELTTEEGHIVIFSKVDWSTSPVEMEKGFELKEIHFHYHSLGEFRKQLALKLEEACEIFL